MRLKCALGNYVTVDCKYYINGDCWHDHIEARAEQGHGLLLCTQLKSRMSKCDMCGIIDKTVTVRNADALCSVWCSRCYGLYYSICTEPCFKLKCTEAMKELKALVTRAKENTP